ncbi:MAG: cobalamin-binding protein [Desulfobacterales bacterium]|nr:cobalamin-binding protein [Desulfobacterales bacterium]
MDKLIVQKLADLEEGPFLKLVRQELDAGADPMTILEDCRAGMVLVGKRFEENTYFISDLMMAGELFKQATKMLEPKTPLSGDASRGRVVVGTVKGDIHDIGKDLVVGMLKAANYDVYDLGVDVPPEKFIEVIKETAAPVVGLSALITTAFESMKDTVDAIKEAGIRTQVKIMIGGGPVNQEVVEYSGADDWGADAQEAVTLCNRFMEG